VHEQLAQSGNASDRELAEMIRDYNAGRDEK